MFYSHEILTSPEHGVATIWLVATLGSRSVTRRLNRKAILDVDVPGACSVIVNPEAPMALRLQGSLLYGVSRVYDQQCGYTLLDAQMMRDKMISMLKLLPGGGLDPSAGKTKSTILCSPGKTGLPGIDLDFSLFDGIADDSSTQRSSSWTRSPATSQSTHSHLENLQLELMSEDFIREGDVQGQDVPNNASGKKRWLFGKDTRADLHDEGILLQPDFEFDEDGNIIEFDSTKLSPRKRRKISMHPRASEGPTAGEVQEDGLMEITEDTMPPTGDDGGETDAPPRQQDIQQDNPLSVEDRLMVEGEIDRNAEVRAHQRIRQVKPIISDSSTTLRNTDLARWNDEYAVNMAQALKQKKLNKLPTLAKKNAAFWVFGLGIGAVGMGLGTQRAALPLKEYSGSELYDAVSGGNSTDGDDSNIDEQGRRVRAESGQANMADVEIGRDALPSVYDDRSSQMPWNITASLQGSLRGQRFGSISGSSARPRGHLTSASPLAGRSYLDGRERLSSLSIPNPGDDLDDLEQLDIMQYLEGELAPDNEDISTITARRKSILESITAMLDQESLNFFEFIKTKLDDAKATSITSGRITFSELLPPVETTRNIAAHGFMNVLTLATKGILAVSQAPCTDLGSDSWSIRYQRGEVSLQMVGAGM
ncbi:uncharacterized protein N7482_005031 [Penicillium canariense]|uniref:Rad21/Rec8-like protein N-terminal domain-containing protein n=1 Tax=Penicillium canariense TaxID=189055 RepID=A0A9W9I3Z4_9EURO|nr:uncharacterized protein N7482_005031 [Penicillium canariense]KAJ5166250.1 hypothetical protein N7482_005031 [Penicillium canariense]